MKTKTKSHGDEVTDFYDKKKLPWILLSKKMKTIFHIFFLKECKYIEEKVVKHINDNLSEFSSSYESDKSDQE